MFPLNVIKVSISAAHAMLVLILQVLFIVSYYQNMQFQTIIKPITSPSSPPVFSYVLNVVAAVGRPVQVRYL